MPLEPLPEALLGHLDRTTGEVATPRDAATVVLLRDGDGADGGTAGGLEAYLLRRQRSMAFAAGSYVFCGGGVDRHDGDVSIGWAGPDPAEWASRLGCDETLARSLVCAAVRETFEESGVLLAGADAATVVADISAPLWQLARAALEAHELSFADFLAEQGLVLRSDLLGAWAHWITPTFEPRRYDTRFFVAVLPAGQTVGSLPGEADHGGWVPIRTALDAVEAGEMAMLPPTRITCAELVDLPAAADALAMAATRRIVPTLPELVEVDGQPYLRTEP